MFTSIRYVCFLIALVGLVFSAYGEDALHTTSGPVNQPGSRSAPSTGLGLSYTPIQQSIGNSFSLSLEWLPITLFGKLGLGVETGYFVAFKQADRNEMDYTVPLNARVSYHLDYFSNQLVVPFVSSTTNVLYLRPSRISNSVPGLVKSQDVRHTVGAQLRLDNLDRSSSKRLNNNFGVKNSYLSIEYGLSEQVVRLGLRFEM